MPNDFTQYIVYILLGLLFGKDYLNAFFKKKFGLEIKNGNGKIKHRIEDLEGHAKVANEEMKGVQERLTKIETKLDILMKHFQL